MPHEKTTKTQQCHDKSTDHGCYGIHRRAAEAAAHDLGVTVLASLRDRIDQTVRWYCENGWLPIPLRHRKCSFPIRSSV